MDAINADILDKQKKMMQHEIVELGKWKREVVVVLKKLGLKVVKKERERERVMEELKLEGEPEDMSLSLFIRSSFLPLVPRSHFPFLMPLLARSLSLFLSL